VDINFLPIYQYGAINISTLIGTGGGSDIIEIMALICVEQ
jgi:hypothetical protein